MMYHRDASTRQLELSRWLQRAVMNVKHWNWRVRTGVESRDRMRDRQRVVDDKLIGSCLLSLLYARVENILYLYSIHHYGLDSWRNGQTTK